MAATVGRATAMLSCARHDELMAQWRHKHPGERPTRDVIRDVRIMADHEVAIVKFDTLDLAYGRFGFEPVEVQA